MTRKNEHELPPQPLWYKDAIFYELRVRSFFDSNGDGIGDFPGLTQKLDYLRSLGVTTLWLLPFYPSPLRDDGYDISDYTAIHPDCGTLHDFRTFLREAHKRELRVVTELVLNHTSERHAWFQRSRLAPAGSSARDFYIWSEAPDKYTEARIIFQDFEPSNWSWDPVSKSYYFHRFYSHQPDLNYDNPAVRREMMRVVDFWLGMGVDGLRLDAVPYLFKRDGTSCENLPETHEFLRDLRRHIDKNFKDRMLLAEANQWPEDAVAYFAEGKECHMAFHFPLMPRMFMAVRMEDRFPLVDIWGQTPEIDESCQWALFLRNHDELTLEMVTDEERDYMYRAYAAEPRMRLNLGIRRRLAPLLGNNRRTIELVNALVCSLPGTPVIYYGDEIGMGDNVYLGDRDGVRTPMQWSADRNAGFSTANPQRLILPVGVDTQYHYQTINVEAQDSNQHSLLWWMRRLIALRQQYKAFGRGSIKFLNPQNRHVLAFVRSYQDERILAVANLSRFVQYVELDLSDFKGMVPVELFGRNPFPPVGDLPYLLTLGPHVFLWFSLEPARVATADMPEYQAPRLEVGAGADGTLRGETLAKVERALPGYLPHARWFRSKARTIKASRVIDTMPLTEGPGAIQLLLVNVTYSNAEPEIYVLPTCIASGDRAREVRSRWPVNTIADVSFADQNGAGDGVLYDATVEPAFGRALFSMIERRRRHRCNGGEIRAFSTEALRTLKGDGNGALDVRVLKAEQSNSSIILGDRMIMKVFRRLDSGLNPDIEVGRFLTERARLAHVPPLAGWIEYRPDRGEASSLAMLQGFVPSEGDAWEFTLAELHRYYEAAAAKSEPPPAPKSFYDLLDQEEADPLAAELVGGYLHSARMLGQRVAELHTALGSDKTDPNFSPEPYSSLYQRSVYQSMRNLTGDVMRTLSSKLPSVPEDQRPLAQSVLSEEKRIVSVFENFLKRRIAVTRQRCHGDLHLGQVLFTGKDFIIIDFEGEPARSLNERRLKRSPLRDVAGMLRSIEYAAVTSLVNQLRAGALGKADLASMQPWADLFKTWASWAFMRGYLETAGKSSFVPKARDELRVLLDAFLMEKVVYEIGYEMNNRPEWLMIPIGGLARLAGLQVPGAQA